MNRLLALITVSGTALAISGAAQAQTAPPAAPAAEQPASTSAVEDIVVTAQRRSERLQDVPIAVTAITARAVQLSGIVTTDQLSTLTPSLVIVKTRNAVTPYLRGVGTQNGAAGDEGSIATYLDGIYIASPSALVFSLANIERVEVLKGPQGTLFGRNATGGLIQVVTPDPSHKPEALLSASYGNYNTFSGSAYLSGGLSDTLAADISISRTKQFDGWGRDITLGTDVNRNNDFGVRSKWLWTPASGTRVTAVADYFRNKSDIGQVRAALPGATILAGVTAPPTIYDATAGTQPTSDSKQYGGMLKIEQEVGDVTLSSLTAYRNYFAHSILDLDGGPLQILTSDFTDKSHTWQQEFLAQGKTGRLNYTGGIFLYYAKAAFDPLININTQGPAALLTQNTARINTQSTKSAAVYGQATYALTDDTNVTAGLRYTYDFRSRIGQILSQPGYPGLTSGTVLVSGTKDDLKGGKVTWRFAVDHHFTRDFMLYGSASRGYKSGVFNVGGSPLDPAVRPEVLDAYEAGFKSQLFNKIVTFNASGFYYDYKNIQLVSLGAANIQRLLNAAKGHIKGADVEIVIAPPIKTGNLELRASGTYLDARYVSFPNAPFFSPNPAGGNFTSSGDASGNHMIRSPKFSSSVTVDYTVPVAGLNWGTSVTWQHTSKFYWDPDNRVTQPTYNIVNGQMSLRTADDKWGLRIFARNIFGTKYFTGTSASGLTGDQAVPGEPRIFGVGVDLKFR